MNIADIIVIAVLLIILAGIVYLTRPKKGKDFACGSCHSDCSSCSAFSSFYEDYKKDQEQK